MSKRVLWFSGLLEFPARAYITVQLRYSDECFPATVCLSVYDAIDGCLANTETFGQLDFSAAKRGLDFYQ